MATGARVLKALCHGPTGAIVASATTSLPEHLGGIRNWDRRYCWLRDAAMTAATLVRLGSRAEAMAFLDWVLKILENRNDPERLAPLYNVAGHHLPPEADINGLPGYAASRPVRVGNAADSQIQLDMFGPVVELVHLLSQKGEALSSEHWRLVEAMVLAVSRRWHEPDHGIWQVRKPPRHHVHSKVMCWVTVDRAIAIAEQFLDREPSAWVELRDQIADDVLTRGWKPSLGAFSAAYDGEDLDAAVLSVGLSGLLAPTDERFTSTVAIVERELRNGPTVYRYQGDDGLPGREGGFNLMTSWLIDAMALTGRREEAEGLFKELCQLAGAVGLMVVYSPTLTAVFLATVPIYVGMMWFSVKVLRPLFAGGRLVIPKDAVVMGEIKHVRSQRDGSKSAAIAVKFETIVFPGRTYDIEGVLTSFQADERKKILEQEAKLTTGRKVDVVFIGSGTEPNRKASMLVGTSGENREDLADEWAVSGLGPAIVAVTRGTVVAMRLDNVLTLPALDGTPAAGDRNILVSADDVRRAQQALKARGLYDDALIVVTARSATIASLT